MAKQVIKTLAGQNPEAKHKVITVRFTLEELAQLKDKAEKWAHGNMTGLVKYAVLNFEPKKSDLAEV